MPEHVYRKVFIFIFGGNRVRRTNSKGYKASTNDSKELSKDRLQTSFLDLRLVQTSAQGQCEHEHNVICERCGEFTNVLVDLQLS